MRPPGRPAKLGAPQLEVVVPRPRLFRRLDRGDADVAGFFYYLRRTVTRGRKPLPLFTPPHVEGLGVFTQRFFRELFGRMPAHFVLVFDNYQDVPGDSMFHQGVRDGLQQLPEGGQVILISRGAPARRTELARAAAALLERAEQFEEAAELLRQVGDWAGLARLVQARAPSLMAHGRSRTVEGWLASLPAAEREQSPWLLYWLGARRLPAAPAESRSLFERAYERFGRLGDRPRTFLAWSDVVDAILHEWGDLSALDRWVVTLEALMRASPAWPSPEIEAGRAGQPDVSPQRIHGPGFADPPVERRHGARRVRVFRARQPA